MKCPKCGAQNDEESQFCHSCGKELKGSAINKNTLIVCVTVIICIAIISAAFVMINSSSNEVSVTNSNDSAEDNLSETRVISETEDDSSDARLGSRENPKTSIDYNDGSHDGEPNPNYGDYYYLDGTLYRDDNEYLGGAGTYTYISGKDPYA